MQNTIKKINNKIIKLNNINYIKITNPKEYKEFIKYNYNYYVKLEQV